MTALLHVQQNNNRELKQTAIKGYTLLHVKNEKSIALRIIHTTWIKT